MLLSYRKVFQELLKKENFSISHSIGALVIARTDDQPPGFFRGRVLMDYSVSGAETVFDIDTGEVFVLSRKNW